MKERMISSDVKFAGKVFTAKRDEIELENGYKSMREIVLHNGGSTVVAITDDDKILLVRQFRYAFDEEIYETPAGKLEPNEDPLECAKRELIEETGYEAGKIEHLVTMYPTPGYSSEKINIYMATQLKKVGQHLDEGEFLEVFEVDKDEAVDMIRRGEIKDAKTIVGILLATK